MPKWVHDCVKSIKRKKKHTEDEAWAICQSQYKKLKRQKKKTASKIWKQIDDVFLDEGHAGWEAGNYDVTKEIRGIIRLDAIDKFPGAYNEKREWWTHKNKRFFGLYPEEDWQEFLEDIKKNGIKEPILIFVNKDGSIVIGEGNHRIQAAKQLGLEYVPVVVRFFGNSQKKVHYFD